MRGAGLLGAAALALMAACTDTGSPEGNWQVVAIDGTEIAAADDVNVMFAEGQISGRSGCNRFSGSYTADADTVSFGALAATRMACPGRAAEIETQFLNALEQVTGWQIDGETLLLTDGALPMIRAVRQDTE